MQKLDRYDHQSIEEKWQKQWHDTHRYHVKNEAPKDRAYVLDMFPYPSGQGLHVGHPLGYIGSDILARFLRAQGKTVLHPMGWDAFGLPAENYAIKTGTPPKETTDIAIERYRMQLEMIGLSYDWQREINTSSPAYYRWTQWLFLELYKRGLAYRAEAPVNWCPTDQTVLANEQVKDGVCERCNSAVIQKNLAQWFFKITDYADELLTGLDEIDWPESIKSMQKNWIGKSRGATINFDIQNHSEKLSIFTTRPDTLFGVTYVVLAPEHPVVESITTPEQKNAVTEYLATTRAKKELERTADDESKTGVFSGAYAMHPVTQEPLPIWIADYVLMHYGTGAVMAVPAHDERDFSFAAAYHLPVVTVVESAEHNLMTAMTDAGTIINSPPWNGWHSHNDREKILSWVAAQGIGQTTVTYRLRDWLVSRQRYWGAPIPIIHCETCGPMPEENLPVLLPDDVDFRPTGESPLARSLTFHQGVTCPKCLEPARREVDTMDTFVDSSWYFLRFTDPENGSQPFDSTVANTWLPVDFYIGGAEHAVMHLLYARFITKVLADGGYTTAREPFLKLRTQGLILGEDHRKMSKRWNNVINPDDVVKTYGADALRAFEMFMGPFDDSKPWSTQGLVGVRRWLERVWKLKHKVTDDSMEPEAIRALNRAINTVTQMTTDFQFNTAISQLMILTNTWEKTDHISRAAWAEFLQILTPYTPHIAHELWEQAGLTALPDDHAWPGYKTDTQEPMIILPIQINGRVRSEIQVPTGSDQETIRNVVLQDETIKQYIEGKIIKNIIIIPGRIINLVLE